jgi:L-threonylcarbamoyladenylate synthase
MQSPLDQAVQALQNGNVVAIPTETVYGLAARIDSAEGIQRIFSTKQRPFFDPLIVHVSSKEMAIPLTTDWSPMADFLAEHFWPGPLTMVLPKSADVNPMITSGLETVGLRMPRHSLALSLIEKTGVALAAPSANRFGRTSPTTADHVRSEFPDVNLVILEGGPCEVGLESTVLRIQRQDQKYFLSVLRAGAVSQEVLEKALFGQRFQFEFRESQKKSEAPGQMKHHYMPEVPLVIVSSEMAPEEILRKTQAHLQSLPDQVEGVTLRKPQSLNRACELLLSLEASLASRQLYAELRRIGESGNCDLIYFHWRPEYDSADWAALRDRLTKAASLILDQGT